METYGPKKEQRNEKYEELYEERERLFQEFSNRFREYCREKGIEFNMVDVGVLMKASNFYSDNPNLKKLREDLVQRIKNELSFYPESLLFGDDKRDGLDYNAHAALMRDFVVDLLKSLNLIEPEMESMIKGMMLGSHSDFSIKRTEQAVNAWKQFEDIPEEKRREIEDLLRTVDILSSTGLVHALFQPTNTSKEKFTKNEVVTLASMVSSGQLSITDLFKKIRDYSDIASFIYGKLVENNDERGFEGRERWKDNTGVEIFDKKLDELRTLSPDSYDLGRIRKGRGDLTYPVTASPDYLNFLLRKYRDGEAL